MTNDTKRLLELAAKAANLKVKQHRWQSGSVSYIFCALDDLDNIVDWDPLTDDGDALRLAVKLRLPIDFDEFSTSVGRQDSGPVWWRVENAVTDLGGYAATRLAIVRAAAAIGEAMP